PEEDLVDYPADGGDDGDDKEESSEDDEMDIEAEEEEEEEEEHPAPADSVVVALTAADQAPSAEETEPFETDEPAATPPPHPAYRTTARISIPAPVPISAWTDSEVVRLLAISSPPASPLSPWSSPPPQIPFPPLPPILSAPSPVLSPVPPPSLIRSLGYRAAMIRLRDEAASTSHSPPLQLPSVSRREDRPEVTLLPWKRLDIALGPRYEVGESSYAAAARLAGGFRADYGFVATGAPVSTDTELGGYVTTLQGHQGLAGDHIQPELPEEAGGIVLGPRYEVGESSSAAARPAGGLRADYGFVATVDREIMRDPERKVGYGITDSWDEIVKTLQGAPVSTDTELGRYMREFETRVRQDTDEIYMRWDDEQTERDYRVEDSPTGIGDSPTGTGDSFAGTGYHITRTAGTRERSTADQETINATTVTNAQLQTMIDQGVTAALAAHDARRSTNDDDSHNFRTGVRRTERAACECTYTYFLKCQPLPFKGTKGVSSLSQWCERMESVFHISNCTAENQVKFATCTLHSVALTWWNTHVQAVGHEAAYGMSWKTLIKMMMDKYCPRNEIRKLEMEIWELKVKGTDLASYTQRFQELALLCGRMFSEEADKIEKYVGGLLDMIHGSVVASKPRMMQEAIEIATELMDKKVCTFAERETASKRKFENTSRTTRNQQQQQQHSNKRQNIVQVYTAASGGKKQYGGSKPLCAKCNYHHDGPCAP
nr:hypothetical protein [Tanacetum cinerariifolium]